jgi:hypothetical protein
MSFFEAEGKTHNFPALASRNYLPNLWLKWDRTDRNALKRDECNAAFNQLLRQMKAVPAFARRIEFADLTSFDPETHMAVVDEFLQSVLWPKVGKELRDPAGHTAFASNDLRNAWQACARLDFGSSLGKALADDLDKVFRLDNYGNVISLFARPNSPVAAAYDHFFPFSRGGRTRSVPGSLETNIIMIQWKANSIKSDTIEQLLQPSDLCTGLTPEQVTNALKSSNGFYGVPAVPFLLGFDPVLDCSSVPDRGDVFANWKIANVEGGKPFRDQIVDALVRIREAEVKREQAYIDRKQKRADRKENSQTKVNPYTFAVADGSAPAAAATPPPSMRLLEYGVYLRATLVDGTLDPAEIDALAHLRDKHTITDAEHDAVLKDTGLAASYADALAKANKSAAASATPSKKENARARQLESMAKAAAVTIDDEAPLDRVALAEARKDTGAADETNKFLKEQFDAVQGKLQAERLPSFTVPELRAKCRALELPVSGKKEELIARITERLNADDNQVASKQSAASDVDDSLRKLTKPQLLERAATEKLTIPADAKRTKLTLFRHVSETLTLIASLPSLTKPKLSELLRTRSLPVSGSKEQLIERVRAAIAAGTPVAGDAAAAPAAPAAPAAATASSDGSDDDDDVDDDNDSGKREKLADKAAQRRAEVDKLDRSKLTAECAKLKVPTEGATDNDDELRRRLVVASELDTLSLAELRAKCVSACLKVKGNKAALRERLIAALGAPPPTAASVSQTPPPSPAGKKSTEADRAHWMEQTKPVLADKCKELGLKVSGTKEELVQRILDANAK